MKSCQKNERGMLDCCAELRVDDGISPRHQKKEHQQPVEHKLERMCSQVQRAVRSAISEYFLNTELSQWDVESVTQESHSPTLIVTLVQVSGTPNQSALIKQLLKQNRGLIRKTVSETITRKRTPALRFQLIEGGAND